MLKDKTKNQPRCANTGTDRNLYREAPICFNQLLNCITFPDFFQCRTYVRAFLYPELIHYNRKVIFMEKNSLSIRTGAAYIRVSTDDQLELSPESQLMEIQHYCAREGILLPKEYIFIEQDGRSGRKSQNRDAFQTMIATAKQTPKPFDVILIWEFSRFARNQDESTFYKSVLRKKLGIDVISVKEPIPQGMYGRLIEMIIEWQDEFYSVNLSTEVTRSMRLKAMKGGYNSKVPLGYSKAPGEVPVIVPEEAHIIRTIFDLYVSGYDKNYVIRYLNEKGYKTKTGKIFNDDAVTYILDNPFYIGKIRWNRRENSGSSKYKDESEWIISDSYHEPIISMEVWERAQERIRQSKLLHGSYTHPVSHGKHWLSGMVKCSICGKSLSYKSGVGKKLGTNGFQCLGYRRGLHTGSQYVSEKKLTAAVLDSLHKVFDEQENLSFELVQTTYSDDEMTRLIYENELKGLENKYRRIREAYIQEVDTLEEYKVNRSILDKRKEELESLLAALHTSSNNPEEYREQFLSRISSAIDIIESDAPYELKGEALRSVVRYITFTKETQTLEFHYFLAI